MYVYSVYIVYNSYNIILDKGFFMLTNTIHSMNRGDNDFHKKKI